MTMGKKMEVIGSLRRAAHLKCLVLWLAFAAVCSHGANGQTSGQTEPYRRYAALKLGWETNTPHKGYFALACERGIKENWSVQGQLGVLPFNPYGNTYSSFLALCIAAEARYYINWNDTQLEGIFIGPQIGLNYNAFLNYLQPPLKRSSVYSGMLGVSLGVQKVFGRRIVTSLGLRGGYSGYEYVREYRRDGTLAGKYSDPLTWNIRLNLSVGYKF